MDRSILPEMEQYSPALCLEILKLFSRTGNGEATVMLMLRHIAKVMETSQAAVILSSDTDAGRAEVISLGGYDPLRMKKKGKMPKFLELPLYRDKTEVGWLSVLLEKECGDAAAMKGRLQPLLEILVMALEKWHAEKLQDLHSRRYTRIERRLRRQNTFLGSLYRISLDMVEQRDYDNLMHAILRHSQMLLEAKFSSIFKVNETQGVLEMKFVGSEVDASLQGLKLASGEAGAGRAWETGRFLVINDYPNWEHRVRLSWLDGIGTLVFIPLKSSEKIVGIIALGFVDPARIILPSEKALLEQFANLAAIISENVRLMNGLTRKEQDFTREINLAAEVQQAYLPFNHDDSRVQVKGIFLPLQTVSGDLFDYFWSPQGDVLFGYVADVTGHGVTAGLRTAALSALFREAAELSLPLLEKMKWVHGRSLGYFSEGAYFAAICFELDFRQGELRVVCGGLYEFFIKTRYHTGKIVMSGSLMGLKRTPTFEERTYPARKGDCFYFLTDGFNEQLEDCEFPLPDFSETCRSLENMRNSDAAWDDMAGLCIQLKPDKCFLPGSRPDLQVYFVGFDEFHAARLQITDFVEKNYPAEADDILLAFHEAAGNALRHGSDKQPIFVRLRDYPRYMSIRIRDSGRGFDSQSRWKSQNSGKEDRERAVLPYSGRGIGIMRECMDLVCHSRTGNDVLLIKKFAHAKD